ncbi:L,D-transpeptidase family protein [Nitratifractor sp.]
MIRILLLSLWFLGGGALWGRYPIPAESGQLLIVASDGWSSSRAKLWRFEKIGKRWKRQGTAIPVVIGRNGMAWGRGIGPVPRVKGEPVKREGDGRNPAGIFRLPFLFGEGKSRFRYLYRRMSDAHHCVDDPRSRYYNRIVDSRRVKRDYRSYERMKFPSGLYSYGIFVDHNPQRVPGAGSCIFLHIKKPGGKPTVGCTAMSRNDLLRVMGWLDPAKHPLLIQAPRSVLPRLLPGNLQLTQLR